MHANLLRSTPSRLVLHDLIHARTDERAAAAASRKLLPLAAFMSCPGSTQYFVNFHNHSKLETLVLSDAEPMDGVDATSSPTEPYDTGGGPLKLLKCLALASQRGLRRPFARWGVATDSAYKGIVSIHWCSPFPFDMGDAFTGEATGFVVAIRGRTGLILTNRHVVGPGGFWGFCIFTNHEEVPVVPIYRDPVHDYGILLFDPTLLRDMQVKALPLKPNAARVGKEIRLVGNDAGEGVSILPGVLSRRDCNPPSYDSSYNDLNINYFQASSDASSGSSGSPIIDIHGYALAMQAGGLDDAATNYFLPLDRPYRALECLQKEKDITRGDIQCRFLLKSFEECERLGFPDRLRKEVQDMFPGPQTTNMIVAATVLPQGPSDGKILEGDILIKVNSEIVIHFARLDEILDSSVGHSVVFLLLRQGTEVTAAIEVGDLHKITPDRFVLFTGIGFQTLSYQQALIHRIPCKGIVVCGEGRVPWGHWLIQRLNHQAVPNLESFIDVAKTIPDRAFVKTIRVSRRWYPRIELAVRNDKTGLWDFEVIAKAPPNAIPQSPLTASFPELSIEDPAFPSVVSYARSFTRVTFDMPVDLNGERAPTRSGVGIIMDAARGLVLVSRATVPHDFGDIHITIAGSINVDANVLFLHPEHNYSIIQYDPCMVEAPVFSAAPSKDEIRQGENIYFLGHDGSLNDHILHEKTTITKISPLYISHVATSAPRYRPVNFDAISVRSGFGRSCETGVLVSTTGTVVAIWLKYLEQREEGEEVFYCRGFSTKTIWPVVSQIQDGRQPSLRILPARFRALTKAEAQASNVSRKWISQLESSHSTRHQLLEVHNPTSTVSCEGSEDNEGYMLESGDILLTLNGKLITEMSQLDYMHWSDKKELVAEIVRNGEEQKLTLRTVAANDVESTHAISFLGAILQPPYHAVRQEVREYHSGVYVSRVHDGSPARLFGLFEGSFITEVNKSDTPNLELFLTAIAKIEDNTYFNMTVVYNDHRIVKAFKQNLRYFPTRRWIKKGHEFVSSSATIGKPRACAPSTEESSRDRLMNGWDIIVFNPNPLSQYLLCPYSYLK
ncbi:trypsin-like serine protease [Canariomyces notabilis]|uniref:Pro-apoptotic serine protease NMA111 n=1 Tax=Canariomyces notabilis TaxID=2074819 RepID=A0AAN6T6L9_9PEZI|nr:trypsin-like serine protease [Canariomyces arenarius]